MAAETRPLRAAVVGTGYLGKFHAEKYLAEEGVDLVAIVEPDADRARAIREKTGAEIVDRSEDLVGLVDCASVAVPTPVHADVAIPLLEGGVDLLVEKPLAGSCAEGRRIVDAARRSGSILQVGHLERFNPAIRELASILTAPRFLECHRLAPFGGRGADVDVVLDLMIHDLDIVSSIVRSPVDSVEAVGVPVITEATDIANARLRFRNGAIANLTASRVSMKRERKLRIFQKDTYISLDYDEKRMRICRRIAGESGELPRIEVDEKSVDPGDALREEIRAFLQSVRRREAPLVGGDEGLLAMELAETILEQLRDVPVDPQ